MKKIYNKILIFSFPILFLLLSVKSFAIEYGGIGGRPANSRLEEPRSESIFIHQVDGGQNITEAVKVINNTGVEKTLMVYSADYTSSTDGGFACKQLSEPKIEVGSWIALEKSEVVLSPNTNEIVNFDIKIPEDVSPGEHNGCILIQEKVTNKNDSGISLAMRTGMRVLLTVKGEITKILELLSFNVTKNPAGNYFLVPEVVNKGNSSVQSDVKVYVNNILNKQVIEFGGSYNVLKGETTRWNFEFIQPFWGGYYKATPVIKYISDSENVLEATPVWFFIPPTPKATLILVSAIVPLLLMFILRFIQLSILKKQRKNWVKYIVKKDESIGDIATKFNVRWTKLSKVNKLNPPYTLKEGDKLLVPGDTPNAKKGKSKK